MIVLTKTRRKIIWQIFPSFIIITFLSLTAVAWYSTTLLKSFLIHNVENDLNIRAEFAKRELVSRYPDFYNNVKRLDYYSSLIKKDKILNNGILNKDESLQFDISEKFIKIIDDIDSLCTDIGKTTGTRITVILPSGNVAGDSFGNIKEMENHKHRYEVAIAITGKKGVAIRKSGTLNENMIYVAIPLIKNSDIVSVVRVSISIASIENQIKIIQKSIFAALLAAIIAAAGASLMVARRITKPIEEMKAAANNFAAGSFTIPMPLPDSQELFQLALTMNNMAQSLDEKIKTLKDRSMELEAIYSSMKEGVIAVDSSEKIITGNNAAAGIFGYTSDIIKGRNIHEISRDYELNKFIKKALSNPEPVEEDININYFDQKIYNIQSTALCSSAEKRIGTLIIFHDITRIRRLETMHKDFAANVSHELKTPLTSIKGFVETLENLLQEEEQIKFIKIIEKNVNRLIALINDLLALSRVEREEGTSVQLQPHDITDVIRGAVDTCLPLSCAKNISIEYNPAEKIIGLIDPILMEQAVVNLLDNAVKYSSYGAKVIITAEKQNQSIEKHSQSIEKQNQSISISVIDHGAGIAKEHVPRIFQRFYRVDKSRSREMGGTGLGLAIVKHIVKYHKGEIAVTSSLGKGSIFKINLPSLPNNSKTNIF